MATSYYYSYMAIYPVHMKALCIATEQRHKFLKLPKGSVTVFTVPHAEIAMDTRGRICLGRAVLHMYMHFNLISPGCLEWGEINISIPSVVVL